MNIGWPLASILKLFERFGMRLLSVMMVDSKGGCITLLESSFIY